MVWERERTLLHCCYEVCTAVTCTRRRKNECTGCYVVPSLLYVSQVFYLKCVSTFIDAFLHFFVSWQRR